MLIVDTGFLYALIDRSDTWHLPACNALKTHEQGWITTWPVITEAVHLMMRWIGTAPAQALLREVADGAIQIWHWQADETNRMANLMQQYANLPMDLADASLVALAEHLGSGQILTTDQRDFGAYRFKNRQPFENVLLQYGIAP